MAVWLKEGRLNTGTRLRYVGTFSALPSCNLVNFALLTHYGYVKEA